MKYINIKIMVAFPIGLIYRIGCTPEIINKTKLEAEKPGGFYVDFVEYGV